MSSKVCLAVSDSFYMFFYDFVNTCKMNKGVVNGLSPFVFICDSGSSDFSVKLRLFAILIHTNFWCKVTLISAVE